MDPDLHSSDILLDPDPKLIISDADPKLNVSDSDPGADPELNFDKSHKNYELKNYKFDSK
jgi:hypothetical protein